MNGAAIVEGAGAQDAPSWDGSVRKIDREAALDGICVFCTNVPVGKRCLVCKYFS